jgi:surfactin synthase thioesterase subunit
VCVLAVQYPGRQDRRAEPAAEDIGELARGIADALEPWADEGPMAFFGHSMGSVVAFETARELERTAGTGPVVLFASGRRAPGILRDERVHQGDDDAILAELQRLNGTESALLRDDELVRMMLPAIRSDYRAVETYTCPPDATVRAPIVALIGNDDPRVGVDEAREWARHTTGGFALHTFPGGHFYLQPRLTDVRDVLTAELRAWTSPSG